MNEREINGVRTRVRQGYLDGRAVLGPRTRESRRGWGCGFALWFAFCLMLGLGFLGVVVWAIVRVVLHFT